MVSVIQEETGRPRARNARTPARTRNRKRPVVSSADWPRVRKWLALCTRAQGVYQPRRPDDRVIFQLVERHWAAFEESFTSSDGDDLRIPDFVRKEFDRFRTCGRPEFRFIRLRCDTCQAEYALPYACKSRVACSSCAARRMHDRVTHLMARVFPDAPVRQWVISPPWELVPLLAVRSEVLTVFVRAFVDAVSAQMKARLQGEGRVMHTGSVAFIQRFTKTLGVFPHAHVVFVDGVFVETEDGPLRFREALPPDDETLQNVGARVFGRMERYLARKGYLEPMDESEPTPLERWCVRATQEPPILPTQPRLVDPLAPQIPGGFSIHAGVRIEGHDREGRERLLCYATRPAFSEAQLRLVEDDFVELELKSPTASGQPVVRFHPVQFLRRLAWLIPPPGMNLVRYFGVFGPTHKRRSQVIPKPVELEVIDDPAQTLNSGNRYRVAWAKLLAKVYDVNPTCPDCGGRLRPVGAVTERNEAHKALEAGLSVLGPRGPPSAA